MELKEMITPSILKESDMRRRRCTACCALAGSCVGTAFGVAMFGCQSYYVIHKTPALASYKSKPGRIFAQALWMAFPGVLVGTTLHYFLAENMWRSPHDTYGTCWGKALLINTAVWTVGVLGVTGLWRFGAHQSRAMSRWVSSAEPYETRVLVDLKQIHSGMDMVYWLRGIIAGQLMFVTTSLSAVVDKQYYFMPPTGAYANSCLPPWQRRYLAKLARIP
eukprot:PhF_6_TR11421/c0_g1_i1/m.18372